MSLSTETVNVETVKTELDALLSQYDARRDALETLYKANCKALLAVTRNRRKHLTRLLAALEAEADTPEPT
jgi:translation elongation factor EF-Tu-like GTPase